MGQEAVQTNADVWYLAYAGPIFGFALAMLLLFMSSHPAAFRRRIAPT